MTKKQTRKVRTVIARGRADKDTHGKLLINCRNQEGGIILCREDTNTFNVPLDTLVEIVAVTDAKPELEVVRGPGEWKKSALVGIGYDLIGEIGVRARVTQIHGTQWHWETPIKWGHTETCELAQLAAEEALATARLFGFDWKNVEDDQPEYYGYEIQFTIDGVVKTETAYGPTRAKRIFNDMVSRGAKSVTLTALLAVELDRHEAENG